MLMYKIGFVAKFGVSITQSDKDDKALDENNVCHDAPVLPVAVNTWPLVGATAPDILINVVADFKCVAGIEVDDNVMLLVPSVNLIVLLSYIVLYNLLYYSYNWILSKS